MRIFILGAGKVGRALHAALKQKRVRVTLRAARDELPTHPLRADLIVLAVRDRGLAELAHRLVVARIVPPNAACVHVAGALDASVLAELRPVCAGVAQMHPMIAFASTHRWPTLQGGHVHVQGDAIAVRRARALARRLGMVPRTFAGLDTVGYHAAAGLVANGAAALAAIGAEILARSGVPAEVAPRMLGPLLRSVAENIASLGFPDALTGPVRRGERAGLERHLAALQARLPAAVPLYLACARAQIPLARAIGEAPADVFDAMQSAMEAWLPSNPPT